MKSITLSILPLLFFIVSCGNEIEEIKNPSTGKLLKRFEYFTDENGQKVKDGFYKEWNSEGKLIKDFNYQKDSLDGECKYFESNGKSNILNYKNGILNGVAIYKNSKGTIISELNYKNNALHGDQEFYYNNGSIECKGSYDDFIPIKRWRYFDKNGKLNYRLNFKNKMAKELIGLWKVKDQRETYYEFLPDGNYILKHPYFEHFGEAVIQSEGFIMFSNHLHLIDNKIGQIVEFKIIELNKNSILIYDYESESKFDKVELERVN